MTGSMTGLRALAKKSAHADVLPQMIGITSQNPMQPDFTGMTGVAKSEKNPE